jgi:hypothetical protein
VGADSDELGHRNMLRAVSAFLDDEVDGTPFGRTKVFRRASNPRRRAG